MPTVAAVAPTGLHLKYRPLTSRTSPADNEPVPPVPCHPVRTRPGTTRSASSRPRLGKRCTSCASRRRPRSGRPSSAPFIVSHVDHREAAEVLLDLDVRPIPPAKTKTMRRTCARSPHTRSAVGLSCSRCSRGWGIDLGGSTTRRWLATTNSAPAELIRILRSHLEPRGTTAARGRGVGLVDGPIHHQDMPRPSRHAPADPGRPAALRAAVRGHRASAQGLSGTDVAFATSPLISTGRSARAPRHRRSGAHDAGRATRSRVRPGGSRRIGAPPPPALTVC